MRWCMREREQGIRRERSMSGYIVREHSRRQMIGEQEEKRGEVRRMKNVGEVHEVSSIS